MGMNTIKEYFRIAVKNLKTRPLRSWLTILGIIIGVFLITSLLSLSQGLENTILKQLAMIGKDIVIIMPGEAMDMMSTLAGGLELTDEDLRIAEKTKGVEVVVPILYKSQAVRYDGESETVIISGTDWKNALSVYTDDLGWSLSEGEWPRAGRREVAVGSLVLEDIFKETKLGGKLTIKGRKYEVVGILKSLGQKSDDSLIHLDIDIFREITGERKGARQAIAKIKTGFSVEEVADEIKENLLDIGKRIKGEETIPISVLTNEKVTGIVNNVMGVIRTAVFSFASIAIIVGGIGIMNTMYTSVRERTREIGILKAVGARSSTISFIFLIESGVIGFIGGLGGILPGLGLAKLITIVADLRHFYLEASMSPFIIIFGLTFSFLVGCLSGFFPSKRAAALKPVEALRRYE